MGSKGDGLGDGKENGWAYEENEGNVEKMRLEKEGKWQMWYCLVPSCLSAREEKQIKKFLSWYIAKVIFLDSI